jgi:DNA-directed RNA polymerase subunit RPC12/RpoP
VELFSISCTTCQAKLKVREQSAIGQILACPKCGSMVLVEAPPGWLLATSSVADAKGNGNSGPAADKRRWRAAAPLPAAAPPAPVENTFDEAASLLSDPPAAPSESFVAGPPAHAAANGQLGDITSGQISVGGSPNVSLSADTVVVESSEDVPSLSDPPLGEPPIHGSSQPTAPPNEPPLLPGADWTSPATQRLQHWLMMSAAATVGVLLAFGLFALVASRFSGRPVKPAVAAAAPDARQPQNAEQLPANVVAEISPDGPKNPAADLPAEAVDPAKPPLQHTESDKPDNAVVEAVQPTELTPVKPKPADTATIEGPPGLTPRVEGDDTNVTATDPKLDLVGALSKFTPFINDTPYTPPDTSIEAPMETASLPTEVTADESRLLRPAPRQADVNQRLDDAVAALDFPNVPLVDFVQFLSDMSTIPITLEPEALAFVKRSADSPVSISERNTTVGGVLEAALAPLGLGYEESGGQLVVTRLGPADGTLRQASYNVEDLAGNDAQQIAALAQMITGLIEPDSWEANRGRGTLRVENSSLVIQQSEMVHFQVFVFCEKLRVARGSSPRSSYDPSLFKIESRTARARAKLETPVSVNFVRPAPLVQILNRLGQASGVRILVDWRAAATEGWPPNTELTFTADKRPLADALVSLLRPMDLTYRVVDENTLQVTTPQVLASRVELELFPVGDLLTDKLDVAGLTQRIRTTLGEGHFEESGGTSVLRFDPQSRHLLASLPQPQHIALAKILAELRASK